jgi:uncharacterized membrane protein (DUF4010 family)
VNPETYLRPGLALAGYLIGLANLVFKGGIVAVTGRRTLFLRVLPVYVAALLTGLGILFFWP